MYPRLGGLRLLPFQPWVETTYLATFGKPVISGRKKLQRRGPQVSGPMRMIETKLISTRVRQPNLGIRIHLNIGALRLVSSRAANSNERGYIRRSFRVKESYGLATTFTPLLDFALIRAAHYRDHEALFPRISQRTPDFFSR